MWISVKGHQKRVIKGQSSKAVEQPRAFVDLLAAAQTIQVFILLHGFTSDEQVGWAYEAPRGR
jgi:hypothetical protein